MGAHFCDHVVRASTQEEAVRSAESYQDAERHESGHGAYGGHLGTAHGIEVLRESFPTVDAARDHIMDSHEKWDSPMLAKCGEGVWLLAGWMPS